jgi:DNA processing protein
VGVCFLHPGHCHYPSLLKELHDPPLVLRACGDPACLAAPAVAVVGSRQATSYGIRVAQNLGRDLAAAGITVVSGMAAGIDAAAHRGALEAGGRTAGVLGCGTDVIYPPSHAALYDQVRHTGVLVSEYPLGARPKPFRFPARNRIISGISLAVVVVEAARRSGALITARLALEQGREVMAVPGRVDSKTSKGVHRLLQEGAALAGSADDILAELNLSLGNGPNERINADTLKGRTRRSAGSGPAPHLGKDEERVLELLSAYPLGIDEIIRKSGLKPAAARHALFLLEMEGLVRRLPGEQYERI